jgi:hypothetical protein
MGTNIENFNDRVSTRLRYIENRTRQLERLFPDHVFEEPADEAVPAADRDRDAGTVRVRGRAESRSPGDDRSKADPYDSGPYDSGPYGDEPSQDEPCEDGLLEDRRDRRTEELIRYGRGARRKRLIRPRTIMLAVAVGCVPLVVAMRTVFNGSPSWPASVAVVRAEIARACQNPDVASEPGQVNFACGKTTRQVLWVFALLTSKDDPRFASAKTGRRGLEPITPAQGGQVAWSLNLHQPYNPSNPTDSLEVAARAINNIVGGATVTGSNGKTVVEPGLESNPANCARYTGSPAIVSRAGYPSLCALPVTTAAGQAALVSDVYRQWVVGASQVAAEDAGVLFENASDPGNAQVQAILSEPPGSGL